MTFIKAVAVLGFAFVTLAGVQPALAKSQCASEGVWRHGVGKSDGDGGKPGVTNQIFRVEARNRSSAEGIFARVAGEEKEYPLEKGFERVIRERHHRGDHLGEGIEKFSETVAFYTADGTEITSCTFDYKIRVSRHKGYQGVYFTDIKYMDGHCTKPVEGYALGCDREFSPEKYRLKVSLTIKDD